MASILIVLDQPTYMASPDTIATPSAIVCTVFSGDIIRDSQHVLSRIRGRRFDTMLIPATITEESSDYEKIRKFYGHISTSCPDLKTHRYENQY